MFGIFPSLFSFLSDFHTKNFFQPTDWFSVTKEELISCGMRPSIKKTELGKMLEQLYPHLEWATLYQLKGRFSQQRHFERVVSSLFEVHSFAFVIQSTLEL
jgi:hypothetical protein